MIKKEIGKIVKLGRGLSIFLFLALPVSHLSFAFSQGTNKFLPPKWMTMSRMKPRALTPSVTSARPFEFSPDANPEGHYAVDLLAYSESGGLEFVPIDMLRSSWFNAMVDAFLKPYLPPSKTGENPIQQRWDEASNKTYFDSLQERGKAPTAPLTIDQVWDTRSEGFVQKHAIFSVFNGLGNDGTSLAAQRQRDPDGLVTGMTFTPSAGFRSGYRVIVTTDPETGIRYFHFDPTFAAVYRFSNGQAWVRHIWGDCTPPEGTPKDNNAFLLQPDDIAGLNAMLDPGHPVWSRPESKNFFQYAGGFVSTRQTNKCGAYWVLDVPVSPSLWAPSGTHEWFKEEETERVRGTVVYRTRALDPGESGRSRPLGDRDGGPAASSCPDKGIPPSDDVGIRIQSLADSSTPVSRDIVKMPERIINYTWLNEKTVGIMKTLDEEYRNDTDLQENQHRYNADYNYPVGEAAYDLCVVCALKTLQNRLAYTFMPMTALNALSGIQGSDVVVEETRFPEIVSWILYYLDIGIKGLETAQVTLKLAPPNVALPGNALSLYVPSSRAIILSDGLRDALTGTKILLKARFPGDQTKDISVIKDFGAVANPLIDALLHYAMFASELELDPATGNQGAPQAVYIQSAPLAGLPSINVAAPPVDRGMFFDTGGKICEYASGKINPSSCRTEMESCAVTEKINLAEERIALAKAILAGPLLDELEGLRKETLAGFYDYAIDCDQAWVNDNFDSTDPDGLKQHKFCECRVDHNIRTFHLPEDACAWAHAARTRTQPYGCDWEHPEVANQSLCNTDFINNDLAFACALDSGNPRATRDDPGTCENPFSREKTCYIRNSNLPFPGFAMRGACDLDGLFGESPLSGSDFIPPDFQLLNLIMAGKEDEALRLASLIQDQGSLILREPVLPKVETEGGKRQ